MCLLYVFQIPFSILALRQNAEKLCVISDSYDTYQFMQGNNKLPILLQLRDNTYISVLNYLCEFMVKTSHQ
jgi:hypothetical protein